MARSHADSRDQTISDQDLLNWLHRKFDTLCPLCSDISCYQSHSLYIAVQCTSIGEFFSKKWNRIFEQNFSLWPSIYMDTYPIFVKKNLIIIFLSVLEATPGTDPFKPTTMKSLVMRPAFCRMIGSISCFMSTVTRSWLACRAGSNFRGARFMPVRLKCSDGDRMVDWTWFHWRAQPGYFGCIFH